MEFGGVWRENGGGTTLGAGKAASYAKNRGVRYEASKEVWDQ